LVTFLSKRSDIPIQEVMFLIEIVEQVFTNVPILERHDLGIQLIFIKLDNRSWVIKDPIVVRPVSHRF
jgi:hypothetical protein